MADSSALNFFTKINPYPDPTSAIRLPETAGVFVIVRYGNQGEPDYLHCAEAINIREKAIEIRQGFHYEDFPRSLEYLIKEEDSQEKRTELLQRIKPLCKLSS